MYGVVRFLDTDLLPSSTPVDYPKIIKSGIDEEHQHHKSPIITGPSGIATLLHDIGRQELLERLFDTTGNEEFDLHILMDVDYIFDLYIKRHGLDVELGFFNARYQWAQPGVRYRIVPEPAGSSNRVGKWLPVSTSDDGSDWGGSNAWVREVGTRIAKSVWFHQIFRQPNIKVSWSGITEAEEADLAIWLKERAERLELRLKEEIEYEKELDAWLGNWPDKLDLFAYYRSLVVCRADCGEKYLTMGCSKCKIARYCSVSCQSEDWKYHKAYCGSERSIPKEYIRAFREAPRPRVLDDRV